MQIEDAELLIDRAGTRIVLLADTEGFGATHSRFASTASGPPIHIHRHHADCFLVLDGQMRAHVAGKEVVVEPETWVQASHGVAHTFSPTEQGVTFLNVHAPSCGYSTFVRGLAVARDESELRRVREAFDQHQPPPGGGLDPTGGVICRLGGTEGETITDRPGRRVTLLGDTDEIAVTESVYGPGERGPDLHVHHEHTDAWFVLEGTLTFALRDGVTFEAGAGTVVVVPPNVVHEFSNEGGVTARFVNLHAPSCGFGAYLRGEKPEFDQHDPPDDGGADPGSVIVRTLAV